MISVTNCVCLKVSTRTNETEVSFFTKPHTSGGQISAVQVWGLPSFRVAVWRQAIDRVCDVDHKFASCCRLGAVLVTLAPP